MAGPGDLGSITARIGLDTSGLSKGIAAAKRDMGGLAGSMGKHTLAITAAGVAVTAFGLKAASTYQSVVKESLALQRSTGGNIKFASELRFAAKQSGIDVTQLGAGLGLLSKHLVANDDAAEALGIGYRDATGRIKSMDELLPQIMSKFAQMPAGPERTALALQLFGRSGAALLPFLTKGADGFAELAKQADRLGNSISDKDAKAVRQYAQSQRDLTAASEGLAVQIGRNVNPVLVRFKTVVAEALGAAAENKGIGTTIGVIAALGTVAAPVITAVTGINEAMNLFGTVVDIARARAVKKIATNTALAASELAVAGATTAATAAQAAQGGAGLAGAAGRGGGRGGGLFGPAPATVALAGVGLATYGLNKGFGPEGDVSRDKRIARLKKQLQFAAEDWTIGPNDPAVAAARAELAKLEAETGRLESATLRLSASYRIATAATTPFALAQAKLRDAFLAQHAAAMSSLDLFGAAPKRDALSEGELRKRAAGQVSAAKHLAGDIQQAAKKGVRAEVLLEWMDVEKQNPGTIRRLMSKGITKPFVNELNAGFKLIRSYNGTLAEALSGMYDEAGRISAERAEAAGVVAGEKFSFGMAKGLGMDVRIQVTSVTPIPGSSRGMPAPNANKGRQNDLLGIDGVLGKRVNVLGR